MINNKGFFAIIFFSAAALCAGAFFEVFMVGQGKTQLLDLLLHYYQNEENSFWATFLMNIKSCFKIWIFLLFCPILPVLAPLCPLICIAKGFSLGFASTMLVEAFEIKSIIYILLSILPQGVVQIPIYCYLSIFSIRMSFILFKLYFQKKDHKKNKNALQQNARHYVIVFAIGLFVLTIFSLVEAFLKQFLL